MSKNQAGFTLIEMLIVLLIVSILMLLIIPNLGNKSNDVQVKGCEALVTVVQTQVDSFYLENHSYPNNLDELVQENYIYENQVYCNNPNFPLSYSSTTGKVSPPPHEND
ncbi:competence type IV pilus major pilin ComGC [Ornithinibacillus xuwenensis]|jgi:competence protein ComGC|uniref:Competence type IV pilus major pilin ComGC n=1 Tax=Ornithinibacillus xuwenensis TaxID=3144668 RepID=A0ABU9XCK3_9BACI